MRTPADASNVELGASAGEASAEAPFSRSTACPSLSRSQHHASTSFERPDPPGGFFAAAGEFASSLASSHGVEPVRSSPEASIVEPLKTVDIHLQPISRGPRSNTSTASQTTTRLPGEPLAAAPFSNGYHFPPRHSFGESVKLGCIAFWGYLLTPVGFLVTLYGLNVVAWGGMLFLLLCNAAPAMCHPTCDDIDSPRRKWVEYDSQILNALFCVTGFGLAPWRFRDLFLLLQYRLLKKERGLRRLAGIHKGWFRLPGSAGLPVLLGPLNIHDEATLAVSQSAIPYPEKKMADPPLSGTRASPTKIWKLDLVVWLMVWNTFFQACLCGFMWGMDRYSRPAWATGLFVGLGCGVAGAGGAVMFFEGKGIQRVEGVSVSNEDNERLQQDRKQGIWHFNNLEDKDYGIKGRKALWGRKGGVKRLVPRSSGSI